MYSASPLVLLKGDRKLANIITLHKAPCAAQTAATIAKSKCEKSQTYKRRSTVIPFDGAWRALPARTLDMMVRL
jgi:hypothetical protein